MIGDVLALSLVALAAVLAVRRAVKRNSAGGGGCCCGCRHAGACGGSCSERAREAK